VNGAGAGVERVAAARRAAMAKSGSPFVTANQIVSRYKVSYQTINYYTALGLLSVARKERQHRLFRDADVRRGLARIRQLKDEGYPLHLIRKMVLNGSPEPGPAHGPLRRRNGGGAAVR